MKHTIPLACLALIGVAACNKNVPSAAYFKAADCQYHVLEKAFEGNPELIDRVLAIGQGPFQLEEYVEVAVSIGKTDVDIIAYGKALNECLPVELRAELPVEKVVASVTSNMVL